MVPASAPARSVPPVLTEAEFGMISRLAYEHCGLDLRSGKQALVAARLGKLLRSLDLPSFRHYFDYVKADRSGTALSIMVEQLTTNHTRFFREPSHFAFLRGTVFPALRERNRIDIWSAPCSSGEEPYSIAMSLLDEAPREAAVKVRIRASDISMRVLDKARRAIYEAGKRHELSASMLQRYTGTPKNSGEAFEISAAVRAMVQFDHLNLMGSLPEGYVCQVVFCRNLMIYFDHSAQENLVRRLTQHLEPGGYLFIGHSENLSAISHSLEYICPAIYRKPLLPRPARKGGV